MISGQGIGTRQPEQEGIGVPYLISIHDVMPETLKQVEELIQWLARNDVADPTLLVVPGRAWSGRHIDRLRKWHDEGCLLAGHGWRHECQRIGSLYHRLHSSVISRNVAEHLATSREGRVALMAQCADWFSKQGLPQPLLYVPPAWALGRIDARALFELPFRYFETQTGIIDSVSARMHRLPVVGYEADTWLRTLALRTLNQANQVTSLMMRRPLRIAIHPNDLQLKLADDLQRCLRDVRETVSYQAYFRSLEGPRTVPPESPR